MWDTRELDQTHRLLLWACCVTLAPSRHGLQICRPMPNRGNDSLATDAGRDPRVREAELPNGEALGR